MVYRQLTQEQRYLIYKLLKAGYKQIRIAETVGVHKSTISRELRRNVNRRGYRPKMAHRVAMGRRHIPRRPVVLTPARRVWIRHYIRKGWSPDQIAGRFKVKGPFRISYQTIYRYLYEDRAHGGVLYKHLRRKGRRYRRRRLGSGAIRNRRFIEERPSSVDRRDRLGDWELDTIVSPNRRDAIVTIVERTSQLLEMKKVERATSREVAYAIVNRLQSVKAKVHTLTSDNGSEFAMHEYVAKKLDADFFFARPYKPWQRGLNENTNGLIREYFPMGLPLGKLSHQDVTKVMKALNNRPRKTLNYRTPNEIFYADVALRK
jgi:IS30 family transposase